MIKSDNNGFIDTEANDVGLLGAGAKNEYLPSL
jgi:hypothetical protein